MKRGRNQRRRQGVNINRALDSNGPDVRIRGTANQIYDKYLALARDATSSGDRVKTENYLQHAEHYFRLIRSIQPSMPMNNDSMDSDGDQPMLSDNQGQDAQQHRQQDHRQHDNRQHDNRHQERREQRGREQNGYEDRGPAQGSGDDEEGDVSSSDAPQPSDNASETAAPRPQQARPQANQRGEGGEGPARRRRRPRRPVQDGDAPAPEEREEEPVVDAAE